jgi:ATP-dependent Clp protease ATP-binding subunit ClpA
MTINPDRWTLKTQEAFSAAVDRARAAHNPEVTPDHVLAAVLGQADGIAGPVLTRVGVEPAVVLERIEGALNRLPQSVGGAEPGIDRELRDVLTTADSLRTDMGDEYLSVEHLVLAMACSVPSETCGGATGSPPRTPRRPSRPSSATAGTSPPWPARGRWTRSSAGTRRCAG